MGIFGLDLDNDQSNAENTPINQGIQTAKEATVGLFSVSQKSVQKNNTTNQKIYMRDGECSEEDQKKIDAEKARAKTFQDIFIKYFFNNADFKIIEKMNNLLNDPSRFEWGVDSLGQVNRHYLDIGIKYKLMSNLEELPKEQRFIVKLTDLKQYLIEVLSPLRFNEISEYATGRIKQSTLINMPPEFKKLLDTQIKAGYWVNPSNNFAFRTYLADLLGEKYIPTGSYSSNIFRAEMYLNCLLGQYWENISFQGYESDYIYGDQYFTVNGNSIQKQKMLMAFFGEPGICPFMPQEDPIASLMLSSNT